MNFADKVKTKEITSEKTEERQNELTLRNHVHLTNADVRKEVGLKEIIDAGAEVMNEVLKENPSDSETGHEFDQMMSELFMRLLCNAAGRVFGVYVEMQIISGEENEDDEE